MNQDRMRALLSIGIAALVLLGMTGILRPIQLRRENREMEKQFQLLLPEGGSFEEEEIRDGDEYISRVFRSENGCIIETCADGYAAPITMWVGVRKDGNVTGVQLRDMHETFGLGFRAVRDAEFLAQLVNHRGELKLGENVDGISGATVTSKAIVRSVNAAAAYVSGVDVDSGATQWGNET